MPLCQSIEKKRHKRKKNQNITPTHILADLDSLQSILSAYATLLLPSHFTD